MHTGLYSEMVANQCELDQIRTERELAIAKARLRAVNEVHDSDAMSQTLERLPDANYIESVMQEKCVNNPGNEVDSRFEGNGVLTPDMSQLLERLPDANCVDGLMQGDFVHNPGNEVDSQFDGNGVVPPGDCGIDDMSQLLVTWRVNYVLRLKSPEIACQPCWTATPITCTRTSAYA